MSKRNKVLLGDINEFKSETLDPTKFPAQTFELYSVPTFEHGTPEIVLGREIGSTKQRVQKGDILLCKINPRINRVWAVEQHTKYTLIASSEWIVIRSHKATTGYLLWCLRAKPFRERMILNVTGIGGSLTRAQPKTVAQYEIPLPSITEQQSIAATLDAVSEVLRLRKAQLDELDNLVKSQFVEMFGDPNDNPMGWSVVTLDTLFNVGSSKRVYQKEQTEFGIPFLRISDLVQRINTGAETCDSFISENQFNDFRSKHLVPETGDILVTTRGTLGLCYIIQEKDQFYFQDGMISWLHRKSSEINSGYITYLFQLPGFRKQIEDVPTGSTVNYLSLDRLSKLKVMNPPSDLQSKFKSFIESTDKARLPIQQSLDETQRLFDSLMAEYFED